MAGSYKGEKDVANPSKRYYPTNHRYALRKETRAVTSKHDTQEPHHTSHLKHQMKTGSDRGFVEYIPGYHGDKIGIIPIKELMEMKWHVVAVAVVVLLAYKYFHAGNRAMPLGYNMVPTATQPGFGDYRNTIQRNS